MEFSLQKVSTFQISAAILCTGLVGLVFVKALSRPEPSKPLPPGPPRNPIIGNLRHYPGVDLYQTLCEWARKYGDIVYIQLPGVPIISVSNLDLLEELLSKRASINSGRKVGYMFADLMGWRWLLTLRQPGKDFQEIRTLLKKGLGLHVLDSYDTLLDECTKELALSLNSLQGDPTLAVKNAVGRLTILLGYGEEIWQTLGDELVRLNVESVDIANKYFPAFWLVDFFPFLRFVPSWIPGANFQRVAKYSRSVSEKLKILAWKRLVQSHESGTPDHSLGTTLLDAYGPSENLRDALGILYIGAVETTTNALVNFFHAMFLFPEVAENVHSEITKQLGEDRLPVIKDRSRLPYTEAAWKESMRWKPWIPLGTLHTSQSEQTINGYLIPKGTMIFGNVGFILTDPSVWGDPEVFRPERFLIEHNPKANDLPNPAQIIFGFGTRICPGMHMANRVVLHMAITIMSLYEILPLEGKEVPNPDAILLSTRDSANHLIGFEYRFVQRGTAARNLLSSLELEKRH